ncbi:tail fiber assembly protein [Enterobacter sp. Bisph1]|uniref:tail fiber assembly protein n=1 Tax=Enterobacter sp. Bisph1 TaxID=1274399 RepID=UPI00090795FD
MIVANSEKLTQIQASSARAQRDKLLADSDWTMTPDAPTDKVAWGKYRRSLRDISDQSNFPKHIIWPNAPDMTTGKI